MFISLNLTLGENVFTSKSCSMQIHDLCREVWKINHTWNTAYLMKSETLPNSVYHQGTNWNPVS